jgi:hypothetical protein
MFNACHRITGFGAISYAIRILWNRITRKGEGGL